jgi:capsular polysaccharide biosynthesis protein
MTQNETNLINIIREDDNPEEAMIIAVRIICDFLTQLESNSKQESVVLEEPF